MKKLIILFTLFLSLSLFAQEGAKGTEVKKDELETKYYKTFIEHFYKDDEPISEIDPATNRSYFIVKYNKQGKLDSVAYYTVEGDEIDSRRVRQTQNVNLDDMSYYSIKYKYNVQAQLSIKEFKDDNNKVISYYKYIWNNRIAKIGSLEKWRKTPFLSKMELESYNLYKWEGDKIKLFTYYNEDRVAVERFHFIRNPDTGENKDPMYLVGNNKISLFTLSKYERFNLSKSRNKERTFYVEYQNRANKIYPKKYNHDRVLIEEFPPISTTENKEVRGN